MGNSLGGKRTTKVMKINGETMKLRTPIKAKDIVKDYPGHVLLESEAVKYYGKRAKPLEPDQDLVSKRLYFLVELPKAPTERNPRRVRSAINMTAKDRLENLMLSRRSVSDLSILKPANGSSTSGVKELVENGGMMRVKMRLPKAEVDKLVKESRDEAEAAAKIVDLCMGSGGNVRSSGVVGKRRSDDDNVGGREGGNDDKVVVVAEEKEQVHWKSGHKGGVKASEKRVSFLPVNEAEIHVAVAS